MLQRLDWGGKLPSISTLALAGRNGSKGCRSTGIGLRSGNDSYVFNLSMVEPIFSASGLTVWQRKRPKQWCCYGKSLFRPQGIRFDKVRQPPKRPKQWCCYGKSLFRPLGLRFDKVRQPPKRPKQWCCYGKSLFRPLGLRFGKVRQPPKRPWCCYGFSASGLTV